MAPGGADGKNNITTLKEEVLGRDCNASKLALHDGFQPSAEVEGGPTCVATAMGEIAPEDKLPSLLITEFPPAVKVNAPFELKVSTRNLVRDRFLGAAAGGYYLEASFLQKGSNLQRGHFHTACRLLPNTTEAPDSSGVPAFFVATQDNGGGAGSDEVTIPVPAKATETAGTLQCTSWAGDGSHRTPMMTRANQTPAIDSVRIIVGDGVDPAAPVAPAETPAAEAPATSATEAPATEAPASGENGAAQEGENTAEAQPSSEAPASDDAAASDAPTSNNNAAAGDESQQQGEGQEAGNN